jgi:hypothetical protein
MDGWMDGWMRNIMSGRSNGETGALPLSGDPPSRDYSSERARREASRRFYKGRRDREASLLGQYVSNPKTLSILTHRID